MIITKKVVKFVFSILLIISIVSSSFLLSSCSFWDILSEIPESDETNRQGGIITEATTADDVQFRIGDDGQLEWKNSDEESEWQHDDDKPVSLRINDGYIQWGDESTDTWNNLIPISQLQKETLGNVEFRISDGYLQYRCENSEEWTNLMSADEINVNNYYVDSAGDFASGYSMRSTVSVVCSFDVTTTYYDLWRRTYTKETSKATSAGSGVIYKLNESTGEAYIITNYHVVYSNQADTEISQDIYVYIYGSETGDYAIKAEYVGGAMAYDIAVLHVEASELLASGFAKQADIGDSNDVYVGQKVIAVGNPEGSGIAVTSGIINVDSEYTTMTLADEKTSGTMRLIRIDAAINPGNSGGGLFDSAGKFIGITNAKLVDSTIDNVGYVIPSNIATRIADSIIYYCGENGSDTAYRCLMGVSLDASQSYAVYDEKSGEAIIYEKVVVAEISDGSVAENILQVGDVIKSAELNGIEYEITRTFHLIDSMLSARTGDKVQMTIIRDGQEMNVEIQITDACLSPI